MQQLIQIFSGDFNPLESKTFSYRPSPNHQKAIGLLFGSDTVVSMSFNNDMSLNFNQLEFYNGSELVKIPPSKRILSINEDLTTCDVITGVVENLKTKHPKKGKRIINIYLLIAMK